MSITIVSNIIIFICIAYYFGMVFGEMKTGYSNDYKLILGMYNVMLLIHYVIMLSVVPFIASNTLAKEYEHKKLNNFFLFTLRSSLGLDLIYYLIFIFSYYTI